MWERRLKEPELLGNELGLYFVTCDRFDLDELEELEELERSLIHTRNDVDVVQHMCRGRERLGL